MAVVCISTLIHIMSSTLIVTIPVHPAQWVIPIPMGWNWGEVAKCRPQVWQWSCQSQWSRDRFDRPYKNIDLQLLGFHPYSWSTKTVTAGELGNQASKFEWEKEFEGKLHDERLDLWLGGSASRVWGIAWIGWLRLWLSSNRSLIFVPECAEEILTIWHRGTFGSRVW